MSYICIVTINVLWLFLTVPWVDLQCMIVVFPDHTYLLFGNKIMNSRKYVEICSSERSSNV